MSGEGMIAAAPAFDPRHDAFLVDPLDDPIPEPLCEPAFLAAMAARFDEVARVGKLFAVEMAQACLESWLEGERIAFGEGADRDWTKVGAIVLADEHLSYWGDA